MSESYEWWAARRGKYNRALLVAGVVAFICYAVIFSIAQEGSLKGPEGEIPELTLFTMAFQAVGYLFAMVIANVLYGLGPLSERLFTPANPKVFRERMYGLGFWLSIALPFLIPVSLGLEVVFQRP